MLPGDWALGASLSGCQSREMLFVHHQLGELKHVDCITCTACSTHSERKDKCFASSSGHFHFSWPQTLYINSIVVNPQTISSSTEFCCLLDGFLRNGRQNKIIHFCFHLEIVSSVVIKFSQFGKKHTWPVFVFTDQMLPF